LVIRGEVQGDIRDCWGSLNGVSLFTSLCHKLNRTRDCDDLNFCYLILVINNGPVVRIILIMLYSYVVCEVELFRTINYLKSVDVGGVQG
jgi:hypothetical protein